MASGLGDEPKGPEEFRRRDGVSSTRAAEVPAGGGDGPRRRAQPARVAGRGAATSPSCRDGGDARTGAATRTDPATCDCDERRLQTRAARTGGGTAGPAAAAGRAR